MALQQPMVGLVPTASALSSSVAQGWRLIQTWLQWFKNVRSACNASALVMLIVTGTGTGSLGPTLFALPVLATGVYRVSFFLQVTTAAGVSSALTPKLHATNNIAGVPGANVQTGPSLVSNDITVPGSMLFTQQIASSTTLSWELVYGSVGVQTMAYQYAIVVEQLPFQSAA